MNTNDNPAKDPGIHLPPDFQWGSVDDDWELPPAPLGVLKHFKGSWIGPGFNTIFRPNSISPTTTKFDNPVTPAPPQPPNVSVLELNLTEERLVFSKQLGNVPNRGLIGQNDICINGVSYLQSVCNATNPKTGKADKEYKVGIHNETGYWLNVPATETNPVLGNTLVRLASIPHGTTVCAQGLPAVVTPGAPDISKRDITPFTIGQPKDLKKMSTQDASNMNTPRIPQDLTLFMAEDTITQELLDNPVAVLTEINKQLDIIETHTFTVSTQTPQAPEPPLDTPTPQTGGGTSNISFLVGANGNPLGPNANAVQMDSTFWVEKVRTKVTIKEFIPGPHQHTVHLKPDFTPTAGKPVPPLPTFSIKPSGPITSPITIEVEYMQIQYAQMVFLDFHGLTWPHASVATLVPTKHIQVQL